MNRLLALTAALLLCLSSAAQASIFVYTDRSAWELAVSSYSEELFTDATLNPGVSVVSTLPGYVDTTAGVWWDSLYGPEGTGGPTTTTWQFSTPVMAFGGNWDCANAAGTGAGIAVSYGSSWTAAGEVSETYAGGFWGLVSSNPFTQVRLQCDSSPGWAETYELDNMVYGTVPEPSSLIAVAAGLLPFLSIRRRTALFITDRPMIVPRFPIRLL